MFKYEHSVQTRLPKRIEKADSTIQYKQFKTFMARASEMLKQNKCLKHLYLLNGTPIFTLNDIPKEEKTLFVSHSPFFSKMVNESVKYFNKTESKSKLFEFKRLSKDSKRRNNSIYTFRERDMSQRVSLKYLQPEEINDIKSEVKHTFFKPIPKEVMNQLSILLKGRTRIQTNPRDSASKNPPSPQKRLNTNLTFDSNEKLNTPENSSES